MPATSGILSGEGVTTPYAMSEIAQKTDVGLRERRETGAGACETGYAHAVSYPVASGISADDLDTLSNERELIIQVYDPTPSGARSNIRIAGVNDGSLLSFPLSSLEDEGYSTSTLVVAVDPEVGLGSTLSDIHVMRTPDSNGCVAKATFMEGRICTRGGYVGSRAYCNRNGRGGKVCYAPVGTCVYSSESPGDVTGVDCYADAYSCVESLESTGDVRDVNCYSDIEENCVESDGSSGAVRNVRCGGRVSGRCRVVSPFTTGTVEEPHCSAEGSTNTEDLHCRRGAILFIDGSCRKDVLPYDGRHPLCPDTTTRMGEVMQNYPNADEYCNGPVILPDRIVHSETAALSLPYTERVEVAPPTSEIGRAYSGHSGSDAELFIQSYGLYGFTSSPYTWPEYAELTDAQGNVLPSPEGYPSSTFTVPQGDLSGVGLRKTVVGRPGTTGCFARATLAEGKICYRGGYTGTRDYCKFNEPGTDLRICYGRTRRGCASSVALGGSGTPEEVSDAICYSDTEVCALSASNSRYGSSRNVRRVRCHGTVETCASTISQGTRAANDVGSSGAITDVRCYDRAEGDCVKSLVGSRQSAANLGTFSTGPVTDVDCYDDVDEYCARASSFDTGNYGDITRVRCYKRPGLACSFRGGPGVISPNCSVVEEDVRSELVDRDDPYCRKGLLLLLDASCGEEVHPYNGGDNPLCAGETTGQGTEEYCSGPVILPEAILAQEILSLNGLSLIPVTTHETHETHETPETHETRETSPTSTVITTVCPTPVPPEPDIMTTLLSPPVLAPVTGVATFLLLTLIALGIGATLCACTKKRCGKKASYSVNHPSRDGGEGVAESAFGGTRDDEGPSNEEPEHIYVTVEGSA